MFYDLNIPYPVASTAAAKSSSTLESSPRKDQAVALASVQQVLSLLVTLGYDAAALTFSVVGKEALTTKNPFLSNNSAPSTLAKQVITTASPFLLCPQLSQGSGGDYLEGGSRQLTLYTRISISLDDSSINFGLTSANSLLQGFDLLSVQPMNEKVFMAACQTFDVDLISLNMTERLPFFLKTPPVKLAISRGLFFELTYAPSLRDVNARRHWIANASALIRITQGRNVILSSAALDALECRGPYDVLNFGTLFGLSQDQAKRCLCDNPRSMMIRAATRRQTHRAVMSVELSKVLSSTQQWKSPKLRADLMVLGTEDGPESDEAAADEEDGEDEDMS